MPLADETFQSAKKTLQGFLESQNVSPDLIWVFRGDVRWNGLDEVVVIDSLCEAENERLAIKLFEIGKVRGLGVRFDAFALLNERPLCYVQIPANIEATRAQESPFFFKAELLCSKREPLVSARSVPVKMLNNAVTPKLIKQNPHQLPLRDLASNIKVPRKFTIKDLISVWKEKSRIRKKLRAIS